MEYFISTHEFAGQIETMIVRSDGMWIPTDPANTDYQQYLAWFEAGNTPEPWRPDAE